MGKLVSKRVRRTPVSGITSDRYRFLGLEQAEPSIGDPLVGPSSIGSNPIPVGQVYQVVSVSNSEGKRYWTPLVGFGTTVGVISVYENGVLPGGNNKFQTIHGLNFVGSGVTIETPPVDGPFEGVGIATVRISVSQLNNQGEVSKVLYNTSSGYANGASDLVYDDVNDYVGIGTTSPTTKLQVVGDVTAVKFIGNLVGIASTATNVSGGIGSLTQLYVSGITTLGIVTSGDIFSSGVITATTFYGNLTGISNTATNLKLGNSGEIPYQVNSGITSFISTPGSSNKFLKYDGNKPIWSDLTGQVTSVDVKTNSIDSTQYLTFSASIGATSEFYVNSNNLTFNPYSSRLGIGTTSPRTTLDVNGNVIVSGISTLGSIRINSGIITAVSGVVTYYGDGSKLTGVSVATATTASNVIGGIASVSSLNSSGISTLGSIQINSGIITAVSGVVTYYGDGSNLSGVKASTATTATNVIGGIASVSSLNSSGISTLGNIRINSGIITAVSGVVTYYGDGSNLTNLTGASSGTYGSSSNIPQIVVDSNGRITGISNVAISGGSGGGYGINVYDDNSFVGFSSNINFGSNISVSTGDTITINSNVYWVSSAAGLHTTSNVGIGSTIPRASLDITGGLRVSGVSTIGTIQIGSGIITSTTGTAVTYYGDGSKLTGFNAKIGISSSGTLIGTAVTTINFAGAGVSSITFDSNTGIATVTILSTSTGGGTGSGITVTNDTSTASELYPVFVNVTTGTATTIRTSSSKLNFNPSTGNFSATQFTSLSDRSQKVNIHPISDPIGIVNQLNGVKFNWKENNKPSLGLIAQEVEKIVPELVETQENGLKSVNYSNMIALLIEAVKIQDLRIQELERRLDG